ncbi:DUF6193 family natural product biosynthesis protein [Streptomyces olivochromogenes]|uniref:Uncharacterized protein n=1 Tax=Streptomyces olivochromogenes TaxID=1963 RepID=A0A250VIR1_STROL|nr:DUF6193 family natural product biosynthesis protein [Streptomyces olivochromogenes]KUN43127.1 hypothetical protein AQJ27_32995 [Streptomyces olivochromogenes]GAX54088.1 hypothetical protein SO3561_05622 [Streptomyces olivochromogenes]
MAKSPDLAALYPDIAAEGSLAAALQTVAARDGISVPFQVSESDPLLYAAVASTVPHRTVLGISGWVVERRWSIRGCEAFQGLALVDGWTEDLTQVVRAAQAWHEGAELADIQRAAPFVHLTGRYEVEVAEHDSAQLTESEWQHLRTEARELDWPEYYALIEAAYAEPALRCLYPFTSHWTLRFSTNTRPDLTVVPMCLDAHREKPYTVSASYMGEVLAETTTAEEAVAAAVRHLPQAAD